MISRRQRNFGYFFISLTCLFTILLIPSILPVESPAQKENTRGQNNVAAAKSTTQSIFNNNLMIATLTLIPGFGWGWIIMVMWNTGRVLASYNQLSYWLLLPFVWIELSVYSYALLKSIKVVHLFKQRKTKFRDLNGVFVERKTNGVYTEIVKTLAYTFIAITVTLLLSAILEHNVWRLI